MAAGLPQLSTFFGLSPNFLNGPASAQSRINLLLFGTSGQLVPIEITDFGLNIPPLLGGATFEFPAVTGGVTTSPQGGGTTTNAGSVAALFPGLTGDGAAASGAPEAGNTANALLNLFGDANALAASGITVPSLLGSATNPLPNLSGGVNPLGTSLLSVSPGSNAPVLPQTTTSLLNADSNVSSILSFIGLGNASSLNGLF